MNDTYKKTTGTDDTKENELAHTWYRLALRSVEETILGRSIKGKLRIKEEQLVSNLWAVIKDQKWDTDETSNWYEL